LDCEFGVWNLAFGSLAFGVWILEFGVWDLDFGIWNFGFGFLILYYAAFGLGGASQTRAGGELGGWRGGEHEWRAHMDDGRGCVFPRRDGCEVRRKHDRRRMGMSALL
jgi:hypothetical protein